MSKDSVADWSATAADNTDVGGVNIAEGCPPSGINNAIRTVMAQIKDFSTTEASGYATTATAAGTTTLTAASAKSQYFTGTTTQTVVLPVTSTLVLGRQFRIVNNSTGLVTVQSSGANTIQIMGGTGITFAPGAPGTELVLTCVAITGTGVASWAYEYITPTTNWVQYTPVFTGFGTAADVSIWSRRVGESLFIRGVFTTGTPTAVEARMTIGYNGASGNVTSSTAKISAIQLGGPLIVSLSSAISGYCLVEQNVGSLAFSYQASGESALTKKTGTGFGTGTVMSLQAEIPIVGW
jgi:hypothetical protein